MRVGKKPIILRDGSILSYEKDASRITFVNEHKGALLRYAKGSRAIMRITHVEREIGGNEVRIYGMNIYGETHAAWANNCIKASSADIKQWESYTADRSYSYLQNPY